MVQWYHLPWCIGNIVPCHGTARGSTPRGRDFFAPYSFPFNSTSHCIFGVTSSSLELADCDFVQGLLAGIVIGWSRSKYESRLARLHKLVYIIPNQDSGLVAGTITCNTIKDEFVSRIVSIQSFRDFIGAINQDIRQIINCPRPT